MSDLLTPIALNLVNRPALASVSLSAFLKTPTGVAPPPNVLDSITLSAAAQQFISTATSPFPDRAQGMSDLAKGGVTFGAKDYSGAAFIGQNLAGAVFDGSILEKANFMGTNLQGARFINALLTGAIFAQSDLRGADLSGAQGLEFMQVAQATFDTTTKFPTGIGNAIFGTFQATGGAISSARG